MNNIRNYRYYDLIMGAFVCVLICSNFIGAAKQAIVTLPFFGTITFAAGVLFFPISYIFSDILTEVYGYARDRRVVWMGFAALAFASVMSWMVVNLPPASSAFMEIYQGQIEGVFGNAWRIAVASMLAYWSGSFANSYVLAKMKLYTSGKWLWTRTIGSTLVGELVDSTLFYGLAFYGIWTNEDIFKVALIQYFLKSSWEIIMTPVTYRIVNFLKRKEQEDFFDHQTNFTPFSMHT